MLNESQTGMWTTQSFTYGLFAVVAVASFFLRTRAPGTAAKERVYAWLVNLSLFAIGTLVRLPIPHLRYTLEARFVAVCIGGLLLLDFVAYLTHLAHHFVPILWRVHRVHHSDAPIDWSTAVRFHPFELFVTSCVQWVVMRSCSLPWPLIVIHAMAIAVLGPLTHSQLPLYPSFEKYFGMVFVTPRLHRTHHSPERARADKNFGTLFSFWDRLFSTLEESSSFRHPVGLGGHESTPSLTTALLQPFATLDSPQAKSPR